MAEFRHDVEIDVDPHLYPLEVIYRVCYVFTDRYYIWLCPAANGNVVVQLAAKRGAIGPQDILGEFGNVLIDYSVRWSVARETKNIREQLVRTALAEAKVND